MAGGGKQILAEEEARPGVSARRRQVGDSLVEDTRRAGELGVGLPSRRLRPRKRVTLPAEAAPQGRVFSRKRAAPCSGQALPQISVVARKRAAPWGEDALPQMRVVARKRAAPWSKEADGKGEVLQGAARPGGGDCGGGVSPISTLGSAPGGKRRYRYRGQEVTATPRDVRAPTRARTERGLAIAAEDTQARARRRALSALRKGVERPRGGRARELESAAEARGASGGAHQFDVRCERVSRRSAWRGSIGVWGRRITNTA